jgi:hypothetical protein
VYKKTVMIHLQSKTNMCPKNFWKWL